MCFLRLDVPFHLIFFQPGGSQLFMLVKKNKSFLNAPNQLVFGRN